jgi:hypothetical protein
MDPLKELWALYEAVMEKPQLQVDPPSQIGTPGDTPEDEENEHPVIRDRRKVDIARAMGMNPEDAHEKVYGEVDLGDDASKRELATTLGRVQNDGNIEKIPIDKNARHPSIYAQDYEIERRAAINSDNLRSEIPKEIPNDLREPQQETETVGEMVDIAKVWDYNDDVAYLQKYGRA